LNSGANHQRRLWRPLKSRSHSFNRHRRSGLLSGGGRDEAAQGHREPEPSSEPHSLRL